jgi:hypothetical protein
MWLNREVPTDVFFISARKAKSQHCLVMFLPPHTLPLCLFLLSVWLRWQCRVPGFSSPPKSFLWLSEDRRITPPDKWDDRIHLQDWAETLNHQMLNLRMLRIVV